MTKVHIVNHTHWDREWYFTTAHALVLSENCFTEVLDEMERNNTAKFCLDGQTSILDDYIELRPERLEQVKKFIKEGRLSIGPWYTQTDTFLVNGEAIIRNLILGIRDSDRYGNYMPIGYLPDTFGFNAQMPTILKNCDIDSIIFFRGINFEKHVTSPYFEWEGISGKKVIAVNLVKGYGVAAHLKADDVYIQTKLLPITKKIEELSKQAEILIPIGEDQMDIVVDLNKKLELINQKTEYNYEVSSYETYMDYLKKQKDLEVYKGEFREPCLSRVHKSIASVRYDIKRMNFIIEQKLLNRIEPLMAIARINNINISEKLVHKAWKKILEGQAHDGIGGCVSDNVAVDILHRMKEADEIVNGIENLIVKRLAEQIKLKENEIIVFNTLPITYNGYKKIEFMSSSKNVKLLGYDEIFILEAQYFEARENVRVISSESDKYITEPPYYKLSMIVKMELPSMGYKVIEFQEKEEYVPLELQECNDSNISNEYYEINFKGNDLEVTTEFGKKINNFIVFEDCGNDGDTYDFSPLKGDKPILLTLALESVKKTKYMEVMTLKETFELPYKLEDRLSLGNKGTIDIKLTLSLIKGVNRIDLKCTVDNQVYSHRLRAKINVDILAKETIASLPFGYIRRDVLNQEPVDWQKKYVEIPIDIETYESSVSVECDDYNITAFSKGMKEYQFIKDSIYLTLFSTTSQLGKGNLIYRPGRASGDTNNKGHVMIETPMAELIGINEFEFALCINKGSFNEYNTAKCWQDYTVENISYQVQSLNKFIHPLDNKIQLREKISDSPKEFSLLNVNENVFYSSIAPSLYDNNAFLLRLKNPTKEDILLKDFDFNKFKDVEKVNYIEEISKDKDYIIKAYDTLTIKIWS